MTDLDSVFGGSNMATDLNFNLSLNRVLSTLTGYDRYAVPFLLFAVLSFWKGRFLLPYDGQSSHY